MKKTEETKQTKTFIKRMLACVMAVVMMLTIAPLGGFVGLKLGISARADWGEYEITYTEGKYTYKVNDDGTATITDVDTSISGDIVIPSTLGKYTVTCIGNSAFGKCSRLTSVMIPSNVTSIDMGAFKYCENLTSIIIPNSVKSIGGGAFKSCKSLTSITIPNSVTSIGESTFDDCISMTSIIIPNSVTSIGNSAFGGCDSLTSITIPNSVKSIGDWAFMYCRSLTSITIYGSMTSIGAQAFYNCQSLESVTIGNGVTSIGNRAFDNCSSITNVYYSGTEDQWNKINLGSNNGYLLRATILYNHTHSYTSKVTKTATCTATGTKNNACSKCGHTYTETTPATGHSYTSKITKAATCAATGVKTYTCSKCSRTLTETIPTTEHSYTSKVTKAATCQTTGTKKYTCNKCGGTKTETIPVTDHKFKTTSTKATTSKYGSLGQICSVCGEGYTATIAKVSTIKLSATSYTYDGKAKKPTVTVKDSNGKALKSGTDYSVSYASGRKNIGSYTVKVTLKGNYSGTKTLTFKIVPAKATSLKAKSQTTKSITLSWKKVTGATGYVVYKYDSSKKAYVKVKATKDTTYKVTDLKAGTTYKFKVRAYKKVDDSNVYGSYSAVLSTATKTKAPTLTVKAGSKKATLNWKKITGATGYQVYMATSKDGKYKKVGTIKKAATVKYTQKDLTKGKTYYFKVRTYKKVDGKNIYSAYSSVAKVKVK